MGYALSEQVIMRDGLMANASLSDYTIMTAKDIPEIEVHFIESSDERFPFKGLGELPHDGAGVCVANAVSHAIGPEMKELPIMPWKIMAALQEVKG
ncbi:MAG: xanthine dehydrogenase family protein molybdopterin-binding subunit [Nitrospirales bacterium]|nr:xanthine dehydrogenase family protein molybdopterin-binding subunit [Nitrospirales bacterium]